MSLTRYIDPLAWYCHEVPIALYEHGFERDKRIVNRCGAATA